MVLRRYWTKACQSCAVKHSCENRAGEKCVAETSNVPSLLVHG